MNTPITAADIEAMYDSGELAFPDVYAAKANKRVALTDAVYGTGPLDAIHLEALQAHMESGEPSGLTFNAAPATLRHTHHKLAQCIAGGMDESIAALVCNYTPQRVSQLKADPAFANLIDHYKTTVDAAFSDFTTAAADLSMDMLSRLREILESEPERLNPTHIMDAIKLLADRTGHAPVSKSINVNVNAGMGERLRAARERVNAAPVLE